MKSVLSASDYGTWWEKHEKHEIKELFIKTSDWLSILSTISLAKHAKPSASSRLMFFDSVLA